MSCVKRSQLLPNKPRISKFTQGHFGTMSTTSSATAATALFSGNPATIHYERIRVLSRLFTTITSMACYA